MPKPEMGEMRVISHISQQFDSGQAVFWRGQPTSLNILDKLEM